MKFLSRISDKPGKTRIRVNTLISQTVLALQQSDVNPQPKIKYLPSKSIHYIYANKENILRVFRSLLGYAIRLAGPDGDIRVTQSRLKGKRHNDAGDFVKIRVRIAGRGITPEMLYVISNQMYEMNVALSEAEQGTSGIRLAACRKDIRAIGGNIWLGSHLQRGLCLYLSLPSIREIRVTRGLAATNHHRQVTVIGDRHMEFTRETEKLPAADTLDR